MLGTVGSTLHVITHLILSKSNEVNAIILLRFTDEDTET